MVTRCKVLMAAIVFSLLLLLLVVVVVVVILGRKLVGMAALAVALDQEQRLAALHLLDKVTMVVKVMQGHMLAVLVAAQERPQQEQARHLSVKLVVLELQIP